MQWLAGAAVEAAGPLQSVLRPAFTRGFSIIGDLMGSWDLARENEMLRRRAARLQSEVARMRGDRERLAREIDELKRVARIVSDDPFALQRAERIGIAPEDARVIGFDASNWRRSFFVSCGSARGAAVGDFVAVGDAVVGSVVRTSPNYSLVLAANDPDFRIAALVTRTAEEGIVRGTLSGECEFEFVRGRKGMTEGDRVISSGYAGRCPKGLVIGVVTGSVPDRGGGPGSFRISPAANWEGVDTVVVLTRPRGR